MPKELTAADPDQCVMDLYEQVLEVEERLIPTGLHVFGQPPEEYPLADLLRMVASFDRPERGCRSLPALVCEALRLPPYEELCGAETIQSSIDQPGRIAGREKADGIVRAALDAFLSAGNEAAIESLSSLAGVDAADSKPVFAFLSELREKLAGNDEMRGLTAALAGQYIEPSHGADIIQNPDILPTGRNIHALNPYGIPSAVAVQRARPIAEALLQRFVRESGRYPESLGMVLWGLDNIKTHGESVAQALWLLGVEPKRDALRRVSAVEVVPLGKLGRPRIDVVMTVSGIFRDLFSPAMSLLDQAVRAVASLDEPAEMNFVRKHVARSVEFEGLSAEDAQLRVFSNAAGSYGSNVNFMILDSQWENDDSISDLFVNRKSFAYGKHVHGKDARALMERALSGVELTFQNIDTTEIGITYVDHYFEYLGGLSKAVEKHAASRPKIFLSDAITPGAKIRSLEETVRLETRSRTLNPKWYEGMLKHGYQGVAEIEHTVSNTFGWSATAGAVEDWIYDEVAQTFVFDPGVLSRMRAENPHAARNLVARLLEAHGRGFWEASDDTLGQLRSVFSSLEDQLEGVA